MAYRANGGALAVDREFYRKVADGDRELVDSFEIPIRSGKRLERCPPGTCAGW
ncbi:hypothetical protein ACH41E_28670 [Streptomyces sp. NPDC020412]|uniref:hypothetical protein n=1 Tax=Streptomyces sp. NPDC020412 TaxID=3365073 RepID=UPI0037B5055B